MASKKYVKQFLKVIYLHSVHHPFCCGGRTGSQFLEGGCWKRGGDFFEQGEGWIAVVA